MLIHTSGRKSDHKTDWGTVQEALAALNDRGSKKFASYIKEVWDVANRRFPDAEPDQLTRYIADNVSKNSIIILNSDSDFRQNGASATNPSSLFTIVIGGNIVSRGVTFDNLLSMFFTRDVKHKIQQDTYIQRARMFGSRGKYLSLFELTIPAALYSDWHRCFVFHRLSLASVHSGSGSPVWLSSSRISAVASSSIDKSTVDIDRGEMAFALFDWSKSVDLLLRNSQSAGLKLSALSKALGRNAFPDYLLKFIAASSKNIDREVSFQPTASVLPSMTAEEKAGIYRRQGLMGSSQTRKIDSEKHFLKVFTNSQGKARLFYKYDGSIQFTKNNK